jgi:eukaryotic-like serine/threonine-protein kinase
MSRITSQVSLATVGNYRILRVLGSGGTATVYQAQHPLTGQTVAIKVIPSKVVADPVLRMRFAKECQVARKLDHPNVVRVLDYGLDGNKAFLVMEYVEGGTLGQRLREQGRLAEAEAVAIIKQIGQALQWAHEHRLVHRDVKPDNVLLGIDGQAKLSDLGLVKNLDDDVLLTKPLDYLGTPNFMAPEQFKDARNADDLCDLYSLAATLYMAVTGVVPFQATSAFAMATVFKKKMADEIAPPRELVPELSEGVSAAILRALKVDRNQRQSSVREFIDSLTAASASAAKPTVSPENLEDKGHELRTAKRYPAKGTGTCTALRDQNNRLWVGQLINVSETGLCLEINRRFERGVMLSVQLDANSVSRSLIACVAWVKQLAPGSWKVGCRLAQPLSEVEIHSLR